MSQCVVMCCVVLQGVAVCCSVLQFAGAYEDAAIFEAQLFREQVGGVLQ